MPSLTRLGVPGDAWPALGFSVVDGAFTLGAVLVTTGRPQMSWGFDAVAADTTSLGVPTEVAPPAAPGEPHPNGVDGIDHVVYAVPDLDSSVAVIAHVLGIEPRRRTTPRSGGPEMAFYPVGEGFIEVVAAGAGPALWGLALRCPDLDATVAAVRAAGGAIGDPRDAIQGGRIATVHDVPLRLAIMEPAAR